MHELSVTQSILDIVFDHARKNQSRKILKVHLVVGAISGVVPDSIQFCFEALTKETIAEGAMLEIEKVPYTGECASCSKSFELSDYIQSCPDCRSNDIEITGGRELYVKEFEVE